MNAISYSIINLAAITNLDKAYVNFWIDKLNLNTFGLLNND